MAETENITGQAAADKSNGTVVPPIDTQSPPREKEGGPGRELSAGHSRGPGPAWARPEGERRFGRRAAGRPAREGRPKPEFDQQILSVRRVTRVAAGGKRFNFSVALVIGNRRGSVGVGLGKGADTALAIDKAIRHAKKQMIFLKLTESRSIPHLEEAKYSSARVKIQPAAGRGVVAGSALRTVIELAGVNDVTAKIISPSKNKLNIARAAIRALSAFKVRDS